MNTMNGEILPEPKPLKKWVVDVVLHSHSLPKGVIAHIVHFKGSVIVQQ